VRPFIRTLVVLAALATAAALVLPWAWDRVFPAPASLPEGGTTVQLDGPTLDAVNTALADALAALGVSATHIVHTHEERRQREGVEWTWTRTTVDLPAARAEADLQRALASWPLHTEAFLTAVDELTWSARIYTGSYPVHQLVLRQPLDPDPAFDPASPPRLAVVLMDVGDRSEQVERVLGLQVPLTVAIQPYRSHSLRYATDAARAAMEVAIQLEPGQMAPRQLPDDIEAVPYASGVVLASSENPAGEHAVMDQLARLAADRGLFLLDDLPVHRGLALQVAHRHGLPAANCTERLDGGTAEEHRAYAELRLRNLAALRGQAIVTVHLGDPGAELLTSFLDERRDEGYRLVFASELLAADRR